MKKGPVGILGLIIILGLIMVLGFIWIPPTYAITDESHLLVTFYEKSIDNIIAKCESKYHLRFSESTNIQRAAALYLLKATFFKNYKDRLVAEMMQINLTAKPHRVQYYINQKFFKITR